MSKKLIIAWILDNLCWFLLGAAFGYFIGNLIFN